MLIKDRVLYNTMETKEILCPKCKSKEIIKRGLIKNENREFPSQIACPNVQIENKNGWLELIQRGYDG